MGVMFTITLGDRIVNFHQIVPVGKLAALWVASALTLGIAVTPIAHAEGGYAGVGFGQSSVDVICDLDIRCNADDTDTALKIFGGYQFNPNFAIEIGYYDLGEATVTGTDSFFGSVTEKFKASGINFAVVGSFPVGERFTLMGKAGFFRWDLDARVNTSIGSGSLSDTGFGPMFGVGGAFNFSEKLGIRVE